MEAVPSRYGMDCMHSLSARVLRFTSYYDLDKNSTQVVSSVLSILCEL